MKVLDLFAGLGGFSQAFKDRGHEVIKVDIDPSFNCDITKDILLLTVNEVRGPWDVILASPPCTEFSKTTMPKSWVSVQRYGCNPDLELTRKALYLIGVLKPRWWVIENVGGARKYFKSILGNPVKKVGSRYLWGEFPIFDVRPYYGKWRLPPSKNRSALRSLIPYPLSLALCISMENELEGMK